ncbi:GPI-anchored cell wall organization protein Ecm33 [Aureobasidium pullulans]|uniref:GPI-anchored cell wall organization protein Ecm33 n=1 Tax=Aureobasidium pullulans TaxID=5580 RepID=A0A4S9XK64_AURPU|nr:GPI-anchored cell wall organization protein Ecm33 [Aureobasidium pullulans]
MSMKYLVPALAAVGGAYAQSSCSVSGTTTINAAADASALSGCSTFSGSIAIATGLGEAVSIPGVRRITGDLVATNNSLIPSISADSLQIIGGAFHLDDLQILSTLSFPQLTQVDAIQWNALAGLQLLSFTTGVQQANELNIQNTQLQTLDGINLAVVDTVFITNNNYLNDISMQLGNISTSLTIESNGGNVSAIFPNLIWANNMTFRNVSQIALNSLVSVNGSLGFYANEFESLQCANLTTVGSNKGDLTIVSNQNLNNVSFPQLTKVGGGLSIQNNTDLMTVNGFPKLATITGAFDLYGDFANVTMPALKEVDGAFNIQSSSVLGGCDAFQKLKSGGEIRGKFYCNGTVAKPSGVGSNPSVTGSGSSSKSTASGAANAMYVPTAAAGVMGVVAALFGLL